MSLLLRLHAGCSCYEGQSENGDVVILAEDLSELGDQFRGLGTDRGSAFATEEFARRTPHGLGGGITPSCIIKPSVSMRMRVSLILPS